jgi:hypothetical protein
MTSTMVEIEQDLRQILWACYDYWHRGTTPPEQRMICHYWVIDTYFNRFGTNFHQGRLRQLAKLGLLKAAYTVRGGARRYYTIPDPERVVELLTAWQLLEAGSPATV